jgi:hypothetical protein
MAKGSVKLCGVPPVSIVTVNGAVPPLNPGVICPSHPAQVGLTGLVSEAVNDELELRVMVVSKVQVGVEVLVMVTVYVPAAKPLRFC